MSFLLTLNKTLLFVSSISLVGLLVAISLLLSDVDGALSSSALRLKRYARSASALWFCFSIVQIILTFANIIDGTIADALDITSLTSFVGQVTLGKYLLFQSAVVALVSLLLTFTVRVLPTLFALELSLIALVAPVFESHSASSGSHALAVGALVVHVIAISLWVGGLIAISLLSKKERAEVLPRFSALAMWSAIAVVLSGVANAFTRMRTIDAWSSEYGYILISKIALTLIVLALGYMNRKAISSRGIGFEIASMGLVILLGSWLSVSQPPSNGSAKYSAALSIAGLENPKAPTLWRILSLYDADALTLALLITAVALYIKGVAQLKSRGDSWPVGRTVAFASGIAAIDFATSGGLGVYAKFSFEYHMVAHMVLGMIAPIGLVLGAPITLALRTLPQGRTQEDRGMRGTLIAALHSKPAVLLTNPISALALFDGSLFLLYFTNLFGDLMKSHTGHLVMNIHFILAGFLFFHVIIGIDPNPKKIPHIVRIVILFAAMSIHAFFSIALLATTTLIDRGYYGSLETPWLGNLLADQHAAGSVGWAMGEIPILLALVATFIQWNRDDSREAKRIDRNEARMAAMGEPDELAQYNNYLNQLQARDQKGR